MHVPTEFSPSQRRCLEAVLDTLIPPDEWPGAVDAGVVDFLIPLLSHPDQQRIAGIYVDALDVIEREALRSEHKCSFADLPLDVRTEILHRLDRGEGKEATAYPFAWFLKWATDHAAEGYYADPSNGGNKHEVSWRMIGFEVRG